MKQILLSAYIVMAALLLLSCGGRSGAASALQQGDTLHFRYASLLTVTRQADYTVASVRNPWDTLRTLHTYILVPAANELPAHLPPGTVVRTPLRKALVYSSVHCSLLHTLGVLDAVGGVCDLRYIKLPDVQERCRQGVMTDCGDGLNPDLERVIDMHPDAILLSPFENSGGYGRIEKLNVPIVECADYMETSALGRAEWMRFYGLLFGVEAKADSLFAQVKQRYQALKRQAAQSVTSLSVLPDLKTGATWYMPGGRSTVGGLFKDACVRYAYADDTHSGSVPLAFETVFDKAGDADVWLIRYNRDRDMTYADLQSDFVGYSALKAFKTRRVFGCNTAHVSYYEEAPFRPDYLLADYIQIFHPEIGDLGGLRYFCPLK